MGSLSSAESHLFLIAPVKSEGDPRVADLREERATQCFANVSDRRVCFLRI